MPISNLPRREEYLKRRRQRRQAKIVIAICILLALVGLLSYVAHRPSLRISSIELSGGVLVTQDEIESKTNEFLKGSYFFLFPKNNAFLYPKAALAQYLGDNFKRIDTITLHLKNPHTLAIEITERKPFAIWCNGGEQDKCYFMDQNSTIFATAPDFSGDAYFKYYGLVATDTPIGIEYMASTTEFSTISDFVARVKNLGIRPQYLVAKDDGWFALVLAGGGQIYFDLKESLSKTADKLALLLSSKELSISSSSNLQIDYIDLRYGNKLFYKLK